MILLYSKDKEVQRYFFVKTLIIILEAFDNLFSGVPFLPIAIFLQFSFSHLSISGYRGFRDVFL
jgi:hypothetical protein